MQSSRKIIIISPIIAAIVSMLLFYVALVSNWFGSSFFENQGAGQFCEALHDGLIKQPANTWSNLGFMAFGLLIGWHGYKGHFREQRNKFTQTKFYPTFFATLTVLLGPGSMALHASNATIGGFFDVLSMYLLAAFMAIYALERMFNWDSKGFLLAYFITIAICLVVHTSPKIFMIGFFPPILVVFIALVCTSIFTELYFYHFKHFKMHPRFGYAAWGIFMLSTFIWYMSRTGNPWCVPDSIIQGHAIWHLLDALSVYLLYRYYMSEDRDYAKEHLV